MTFYLKSIKWRLQLWYGLILVGVLMGFGVTAYQLERNRVFRRVDDQIHQRVGALARDLHRPLPRGPQGGLLDDDQPPPGMGLGPGPEGGPGPGGRPPGRLDLMRRGSFQLSPQAAALFGTNDPGNFFFRIRVITDRGDHEIARSDNFRDPRPEVAANEDHYFDLRNHVVMRPVDSGPDNSPGRPPALNVGDERITLEFLPSGEAIEVGCSIAPELKELRRAALNLTGIGSLILLMGLAGGGWLVGRALRPISAISVTASKISAGDLSQRIDTAETESELGQLAAVLNATFARLEAAFAQQKQFASDAAHELRTPVSVILTQTQTALARDRDAAGYKQTVEACQRAAQRMRRLIESLLELARFDAGQEVLKRLTFDLSQIVKDAAELVQPLADERQVKIVLDAAPLKMDGDPERLAQVVTNLLINAIQYNQAGGEVRVKLANAGGLAVLEIVDTGKGIAAADLPRVFERFYRADASRTGGSAGLGLSICKAIVEAHGGTIAAANNEPQGATFTVRLPGAEKA
jgi:two-component system OmpR family sensor kinase